MAHDSSRYSHSRERDSSPVIVWRRNAKARRRNQPHDDNHGGGEMHGFAYINVRRARRSLPSLYDQGRPMLHTPTMAHYPGNCRSPRPQGEEDDSWVEVVCTCRGTRASTPIASRPETIPEVLDSIPPVPQRSPNERHFATSLPDGSVSSDGSIEPLHQKCNQKRNGRRFNRKEAKARKRKMRCAQERTRRAQAKEQGAGSTTERSTDFSIVDLAKRLANVECRHPNGATLEEELKTEEHYRNVRSAFLDSSGIREQIQEVSTLQAKINEYNFLLQKAISEEDVDFANWLESNIDHLSSKRDVALASQPQLTDAESIASSLNSANSVYESLLSTIADAPNLVKESADAQQWVSYLENLAIFGYQLANAADWSQVVVAFCAYVKMHTSTSVITTVLGALNDFIAAEAVMNRQPNGVSAKEGKKISGTEVLDKWKLLRTNKMFSRLAFLISAAMSISAGGMHEGFTWSMGAFDIIKVPAMDKQTHCSDVLDCIIQTFVWMADTGVCCMQEKSLAPLLYSDNNVRKFNEKCDEVFAYESSAINGTVEDMGAYERKCHECMAEVVRLKSAKQEGVTASWLQFRYERLVNIADKLQARQDGRAFREQPFGFHVTGPPRTGKTNLTMMTGKQALAALGYDWDPKRVLVKNAEDAFDSKYFQDVLFYILDDVGKTKSDFVKTPHTDDGIKLWNNLVATAVKAEINLKGRILMDFKVGAMTSNKEDMDAPKYCNCPAAVLSRFVHVHVKVLDEYRNPGEDRVNPNHPDLIGSPPTKNIWALTIKKCVSYTDRVGNQSWRFEPITINMPPDAPVNPGGKLLCKDLDIGCYMAAINVLVRNHSTSQKTVVQQNSAINELKMCEKCQIFQDLCPCSDGEEHWGHEATMRDASFDNEVYKALTGKQKKAIQERMGINRHFSLMELGTYLDNLYDLGETDPSYQSAVTFVKRQRAKPNGVDAVADAVVQGVVSSCGTAFQRWYRSWLDPFNFLSSLAGFSPVRNYATKVLADELKDVLDHSMTPWLIRSTPEFVFQSRPFQRMVCMWQRGAAHRSLRWHYTIFSLSSAATLGYYTYQGDYQSVLYTSVFAVQGCIFLWSSYVARIQALRHEYTRRRDALQVEQADTVSKYVVGGALGITGAYIGLKMFQAWNRYRQTAMPAGIVQSKSDSWLGSITAMLSPPPKLSMPENACAKHIVETFRKGGLYRANFKHKTGETYTSNFIFLQKFVGLLPYHMFFPKQVMTATPVDTIDIAIYKTKDQRALKEFTATLGVNAVRIGDLDVVMVFVPNSFSVKNRVKWLPDKHIQGNFMANYVSLSKAADFAHENVQVGMCYTGHCYLQYMGGNFSTEQPGDGRCMSPIVLDSSTPTIAGLVASYDATEKNIGFLTVTRSEYEAALAELSKFPTVVISASDDDLPELICEKKVLTSSEPHPKSMAAHLPAGAHVTIHGSTELRTQQKSSVTDTVISKKLEEHGIPNQWSGPALDPNWRAYNQTLEKMIDPPKHFDPKLLEQAQEDWLSGLLPLLPEYQGKKEPLTDKEVMMGIPGNRFCDAIPMDTGGGFNLPGKKSKYVTEIRDGEQLVDRIPTAKVLNERDRILDCYKNSKRAYPIFKSTLKDEPTKRTKKKVRVFQAVHFSFGMLVRKYFMPIVMFLNEHPLEAESAVGVNCRSQDWQTLMEFAREYCHTDEQEMLAWDYKSFDTRLSCQVLMAVYASYIRIARTMGYSEEDLHIMRMMVADIVHPTLDYNGTLLEVFNLGTSGINITVQVNGTSGCLYVRMFFFSKWPDKKFRDYVRCITYGDDCAGSRKKEVAEFDFFNYCAFLREHGLEITPPDKEATPKATLPFKEVDFLKRKSNFIPEIGCEVGKLDEESIFKMLHNYMKRRNGPSAREVTASNVTMANYEWFAFGREHYDRRMKMLKEVCLGIPDPLVLDVLDKTFDQHVEEWHAKYGT